MEHPGNTPSPPSSNAEPPGGRELAPDSKERAENRADIEKYIAAVVSSISRVRAVVLVLMTASILSFTAYWRFEGTWLDKRIAIRREALALFEDDQSRQRLLDPESSQRGQMFIDARGLDVKNDKHKASLVDEIKEYEKMRRERDIVRVPFFGIEVETNDVTLFSGFTFVVGLIWLRYSLLREMRNLKLAFTRAKEGGMMRLCYELLAMQQVLSTPPIYGQDNVRMWNMLPKLLLVIPLVVYMPLVWSDFRIQSVAYILDPYFGMKLGLCSIFLGLTLVLTLQCIHASIRIDKVWKEAASDADPIPGG